jgi:integrase/recombinase XerD
MAKPRTRPKDRRAPLALIGPPDDPQSLYHQMREFLGWLRERNYAAITVEDYEIHLGKFIAWCDERGLTRPSEITRPILERYQRHLSLYRKKNGEPISVSFQIDRINAIRSWFRWLIRARRILSNPASDLDLPRHEKRLPKAVLTAEEAERILAVPNLATNAGLRDRAILEVLYSTGMRRMELIGLKLGDIDTGRGTVMIRQGKGHKDRMIPIGARALAWIARYRDEVRPTLRLADDDGTLFLTQQGERIASRRLTQIVCDTIKASGVEKEGSCHLFRHTCATLMLEGGADIRFIQAQLGHARLDTTMVYTQVSIRMLKDIHTATHPARLDRTEPASAMVSETGVQDLLADLDVNER